MTDIDGSYVAYLKSEGLYTNIPVDGSAAWGDLALDIKLMTPIATFSDAGAESGMQRFFLHGPLVKDVHVLKGQLAGLIGKVVKMNASRLGYEINPANVFVIGAEEGPATTKLTVLKRLQT